MSTACTKCDYCDEDGHCSNSKNPGKWCEGKCEYYH